MGRREDIAKAAGLYRSFREARPKVAKRMTIDIPKAVAVMGRVEFIGYMTTHNGKAKLYYHEFSAGSRPLMCAGTGRGQLYLLGGRFKVTGRGITDVSRSGRVVDTRPKWKLVPA